MSLPLRNSRIRLPQGQIFWREIGQGQPLILLHGYSDDSRQWLPLIEHIGTEYHCFALDLLGFGDSEHPDVHYSINWQVEALNSYLEALNLKQVYLIGHSLGAWIAASYALQYPEQVSGLVLVSPLGVEIRGQKQSWWWERCLIARPPVVYWLLRILLPILKPLGLEITIEEALSYREQLIQSPAARQLLFERRSSEIKAELLTEAITNLISPTLIVTESQAPPQDIDLSKTYTKLIRNSQLQILKFDSESSFEQQLALEITKFIEH